MNEISVLASETHEQAVADFKVSERYGYRFIMKVKKIRDERLYKELGFSTFDDYCDSAWKTVRRSMDQKIQIAENFGNEADFENSYSQLGHSKSLMLARMEPEVRQQIETTVNVSETTVKQLSQLEKQLKEKTELLESSQHAAEHWQKVAKQAQSAPARVETRTIEIVPDSVKREMQQKDNQISNLNSSMEVMKSRLAVTENLQKQYERDSKEYKEIKNQINFLNLEKNDLSRQIESATALSGLSVKIDHFLKTELAPLRYSRALERLDSEIAVRNLTDIIHSVENWVTDMRRYIPQEGRIIVEVMDYDHVS